MWKRNRAHQFPVLMVSPQLYRSPQPNPDDLASLKEKGLKMVVNLREESQASEDHCKIVGLDYLYLSVVDWDLPSINQVMEFLDLFKEGSDKPPVLVHCLAGVGRTGIMVSCYRIARKMSAQQAIALSDQETPHMGMSERQRSFLHEFELMVQNGLLEQKP